MNKLETQTSPYLLQHAENPVAWLPWGPEALQSARRENKPILLSIGYSACHWCHVMAHESFEDAETAALMNKHYINIKVDREERPDLDKIYQAAHHILTRNQGGWPLTMFLTAKDHIPFFGGTYFPRETRSGLPGFKDVLHRVATAYREQEEQISEFKNQMKAALAQTIADDIRTVSELDPQLILLASSQLTEDFDETWGGFGKAPKFPQASCLELLLAMHTYPNPTGDSRDTLRIVVRTLEEMARGGIYDHLGGGFCRYSVDESWTIPHFEKMLYDNGALLSLYAKTWFVTGAPFFRSVVEATADWVVREMQNPDGGFYSSLDADSDGEEGRFYVWTRDEVRSIIGENYDAFSKRYGLDKAPNFEGHWHLRLPPGSDDTRENDLSVTESIEDAKRALFKQREKRLRPGLDDKILTAWNALTIKGLAKAGEVLHRVDYIEVAEAAVTYIESVHWQNGRLLVTSKNGTAHLNAYLDDYAYLLDALLTLVEARWDDNTLSFAKTLADTLLDYFEDHERGGFFFTSNDHEELIQRSKSFTDDAMASGNAIAALALLKISYLVGAPRYHTAAERTLRAAIGGMSRWPSAHASMMQALMEYTHPPRVVVLRGDVEELKPWIEYAETRGVRRYSIPRNVAKWSNDLCGRVAIEGHPVTAYLCRGHTCSLPITRLKKFQQLLRQ